MRRFAPFLIIVAVLAIVVVVFTFRDNQIPTAPPQDPGATPAPDTSSTTPPPADEQPLEPVNAAQPGEPDNAAVAFETPVTDANWAEKLDELLSNEKMDEDVKADKIADMIPKVSPEAQKELAEHLINLMPDEAYDKAAAILKNESTPGEVSKVLLDDLFNRDHSLMLPLVLDVAKNEKHPLKGDAKEMLEMFLQEDYGTNWNQWTDAVEKQLKAETP
jgi:hypothetical protein